MVSAEVKDSVDDGKNGTPLGVPGAAKSNQFALDPILLMRKFQSHMCRGAEVGLRSNVGIEPNGASEEMDVTEAEWCGVWIVGMGIFPRAKKEVEPE